MNEPHFKSSLTENEIENNFKDVDIFSGIMEGLNEAFAYEKEQPAHKPSQESSPCRK